VLQVHNRRIGVALPPRLRYFLARHEYRLGIPMAEHNEVAYTTADGNDYPAHEQTYEGFIMLVKYGSAAVIFIVAMMAIFLT
jgi:Bacterial aa3 type cytochrome c oxidase subunit IV